MFYMLRKHKRVFHARISGILKFCYSSVKIPVGCKDMPAQSTGLSNVVKFKLNKNGHLMNDFIRKSLCFILIIFI